MDDIDSIFSDDSDTECFPEDLLNNIPEDSDSDYKTKIILTPILIQVPHLWS
jgi:hypothetical protein